MEERKIVFENAHFRRNDFTGEFSIKTKEGASFLQERMEEELKHFDLGFAQGIMGGSPTAFKHPVAEAISDRLIEMVRQSFAETSDSLKLHPQYFYEEGKR